MFNRKNFTSTEVRRRLLTNGPWQKLVPRTVANYLRKIDGDERLRDISKSDKTKLRLTSIWSSG